jgi:hypothetical protein
MNFYRREFIKRGLIAVSVSTIAGKTDAAVNSADSVEILMSAAAAQFPITKAFLQKAADDIKRAADRAAESKNKMTEAECQKTWTLVGNIVAAVVAIVVAVTVTVFSFGSGASSAATLTAMLIAVANWRNDTTKLGKMTSQLELASDTIMKLLENSRDATASLDFYVHIAKDKAYAAKLLEAIKAKNATAIKEMLRLDIPRAAVDVSEMKEDTGGIALTFRVNTVVHCLYTATGCSGKISPIN